MNICQSLSLGCALAFGLAPPVFAQSAPPPSKNDSEIVVNPTIAECNAGWENSAKLKWSKDQFEQFCAIQKSPAPILANPTLDECKGGWNAAMRWTKDQFDGLCELLQKSK